MCNILYMYMYLYLYRNHVKELYIYPSGRHQSSCFQRKTGRRTTRSSRLSDPERRRSERQIRNPTRKSSDASIKTRCFISESNLLVVETAPSSLADTRSQTCTRAIFGLTSEDCFVFACCFTITSKLRHVP